MIRKALFVALLAATSARAHFVFVVPQPGGASANVILSETLDADEGVDVGLAGRARLAFRAYEGGEQALTMAKADGAASYAVPLDAPRPGVVYGDVPMGVTQRGGAPRPYLLSYHSKAVIGDAFDARATLGPDRAATELVPVGAPGALKFRFVARGEPRADMEVIVLTPGGETRVKTDAQGETPAFDALGRYGAWARFFEDAEGTHEGKSYAQVRHYAMLVVNVGEPADARVASARPHGGNAFAPATQPAQLTANVRRFDAALPEPTSSFGAAGVDGYVYVYGGHVSRTHAYDTTAVSGKFARLSLTGGAAWEPLPAGPALQGTNLATHDGRVYRAGGMRPANAPGEKPNLWSVADVAAFDPARRVWAELPPLPAPRSSHDLVALGGKLYVVGGWQLNGAERTAWPDALLALDLAAEPMRWTSTPAPFKRRALIAAAFDGKLWAIGGFDEESEPSRRVDVYDPRANAWTSGPELPGPDLNGFAPAACVQDGRLYVSTGDGALLRLNARADGWDAVAAATPRIVHRLVPFGGQVLVLGGAARGDNLDLVEAVRVDDAALAAPVAEKPTVTLDAPATQPTVAAEVSRSSPDAGPVAQTCCPVMTARSVDAESIAVSYEGRTVWVCCDTCAEKWDADPAAYARVETLPQFAGLALPARAIGQTFCPVYKDRVVSAKDPTVTYRGKTVHVFNGTAVRRWNENPAKYADAALLPQLKE